MRLSLLIPLILLFVPAQETADISGKIEFPEGAAPKRTKPPRIKDPAHRSLWKAPDPSPAVVYLVGPASAKVADRKAEMRQKDLEFRPRVLAIQSGTTVRFPCEDSIQHHVFSYSKTQRFDLGHYGQGEAKEETFTQPGVIEVSCEIHSHMRGYVVVVDHPYYAVADADGRYTIPKVPAGAYTLVAWHEDFEPLKREIEVKAGSTTVDLKFAMGGAPVRTLGHNCCSE